MQFDTAILTEEGVRLLTTASLDDRLVLTKFLFTANPFEPSPDLTTLTNTWGDGHVETQRTEGGVIHVDASASNRLTSGRAYGFGISRARERRQASGYFSRQRLSPPSWR